MIDPVTALGTASSIVGLLEFSWELLASTQKVYQTGENEESSTISLITQNIQRLARSIIASEEYNKDLQALVKESHKIADELLDALGKLKLQGKKTIWNSFMVALKDAWSRGKIERFSHKLVELQTQITSNIQMLTLQVQGDYPMPEIVSNRQLRNRVSDFSLQMAEMRTDMTKEIRGLRDEVMATTTTFENQDPKYEMYLKSQLKIGKDTEQLNDNVARDMSVRLQTLSGKLSMLCLAEKTTEKRHRVLESLRFSCMASRQSRISKAHAKTFLWILRRSASERDQSRCMEFIDWLQSAHKLFWIQGKPGSGKSTLMKFLVNNPTIINHLQSWAGNRKLVLASYFFWDAGSSLQKSQEGLLRTLLFDTFQQYPDLIDLGDDWSKLGNWTVDDLLGIYSDLVKSATNTKFCVLIDGLDECEGSIEDLLKTIQTLESASNVKLCVSSRSWPAFSDRFGSSSLSIRLEDLTRNDIRKYVTDNLNRDDHILKAKKIDSTQSGLIDEICRRARGVFLWVYLVVRDIVEGFTNGDSFDMLQSRVEGFPEDLGEFIKRMVDTIPKVYAQKTARLFDIARSTSKPQYMIAYSYIDEVDVMPDGRLKKLVHDVTPMSQVEVNSRQDRVQRQLDARCKGLLEITLDDKECQLPYFNMRVDFIHRTVREFLLRPQGIGTIFQGKLGSFSTALVMCKAVLAMLEKVPNTVSYFPVETEELVQLVRELFYWVRQESQNVEAQAELIMILRMSESAYGKISYRFKSPAKLPSFMALAWEENMFCYFQDRFSRMKSGATIGLGEKPLLEYALSGDIPPTIIKDVLTSEIGDKKEYLQSTLWVQFITCMQRHRPAMNKNLRVILDILIREGANLQVLHTLSMRAGRHVTRQRNRISLGRTPCLHGEADWQAYNTQWKVDKSIILGALGAYLPEDLIALMMKTSKSQQVLGHVRLYITEMVHKNRRSRISA